MTDDDPTIPFDDESDATRDMPRAHVDPLIGSTVAGRYHVLGRIGEGGFGVVYEAEQRAPVRRRVALKVIKPGMDSESVIARFEAERQALAVMDHPAIAKVLDAGRTDRNLPFFVMELVRGDPITDFCDDNRLSIDDRLELMIDVARAVQHAHAKGVVHRDLKPSNILVGYDADGKAAPKVIDFGVAKALNQRLSEHTIFTGRGQLIGTPEYMSPEQASMSGADIDTRADVYSLGVLLYELLTGVRPFDLRQAAFDEIQRVIRETDPAKPSTRLTTLVGGSSDPETSTRIAKVRRTDARSLLRVLKRDLDWVVMRCLEKDRERRYETADALAAELRRYLDGEPVDAGPPSAAYRFGKFAKRHRGPLTALAAIFVLLVGGVVTTTVLLDRAVEAEGAARDAESAARLAEQEQARLAREAEAAAAEARRERDAADEARRAEAAMRTRADELRRQAEWDAYVANIGIAGRSAKLRDYAIARERLLACSRHLRDWEWGWLISASDRSIFTLDEHESQVTDAAFSPDGSRVVTASVDGIVRVWSTRSGEVELAITELDSHLKSIWSVSFSPNGMQIASGAGSGAVRIWNAANGEPIVAMHAHTGLITSVAFSPDGSSIVSTSLDGTARVWDVKSGAEVSAYRGHDGDVVRAAYSPDGSQLLTYTKWGVDAHIWNAATGSVIATLKGHEARIEAAVFSSNGQLIATASSDNTARLWSGTTGELISVLSGHDSAVESVAFSPNGELLVTTSWDGTGRVWDALSGRHLATMSGHEGPVGFAAFSPDGRYVVTASRDSTGRVWDANSGKQLTLLAGHTAGLKSVAFSSDGTRILTAAWDETARIWDAKLVDVFASHEDQVLDAAFNGAGTRIVTASRDRTAIIWNTATGALISRLSGHGGWVTSAAFDASGERVVTASEDRTARIWSSDTGRELIVLVEQGRVRDAAFSPDKSQVVTASSNKFAHIWDLSWDLDWPRFDLNGHEMDLTSASFSADGSKVLTSSYDETVRIWDAVNGEQVGVISEHDGPVHAARYSQDGRHIVTVTQNLQGGTAYLWHARTRNLIQAFTSHREPVLNGELSLNGNRVLTSSRDGTARIWNVDSGELLATIAEHTGSVHSAAFSPDGTRIVTASADGTVRIHDCIPNRIRHQERLANERGEDGSAVVRQWLDDNGLLHISPVWTQSGRVSSGSTVSSSDGDEG